MRTMATMLDFISPLALGGKRPSKNVFLRGRKRPRHTATAGLLRILGSQLRSALPTMGVGVNGGAGSAAPWQRARASIRAGSSRLARQTRPANRQPFRATIDG